MEVIGRVIWDIVNLELEKRKCDYNKYLLLLRQIQVAYIVFS